VLGMNCNFSCRPGDVADVAVAAERKRELARQEREANAFASELLMPELLVHEQARATGCNLSAMAERFDVSVPAIRLRLLTLGLLPAWMASVPVVGKDGRR
jgi:Zn-dependent peptidase ImmA (M78 family)